LDCREEEVLFIPPGIIAFPAIKVEIQRGGGELHILVSGRQVVVGDPIRENPDKHPKEQVDPTPLLQAEMRNPFRGGTIMGKQYPTVVSCICRLRVSLALAGDILFELIGSMIEGVVGFSFALPDIFRRVDKTHNHQVIPGIFSDLPVSCE
jgi:hypothetical protein